MLSELVEVSEERFNEILNTVTVTAKNEESRTN